MGEGKLEVQHGAPAEIVSDGSHGFVSFSVCVSKKMSQLETAEFDRREI